MAGNQAIRKYRTPRMKREDALDPGKTKRCAACGEIKPHTEFYARAHNRSSPTSECKACMKLRNQNKTLVDPHSSSFSTEEQTLRELAKQGIPALPGKALGRYYCDILAWGCVPIEVKSSTSIKGRYTFKFTALQVSGHLRGDVLVLVCVKPDSRSFHVFDARSPLFYQDGKLRKTLTFNVDPKDPPNAKVKRVLTVDIMEAARDNWGIVEDVRLRNAAAVKEQSDRERLSEVYLREAD